jgi:Uma2 family endonuclease
MATTAAPITLDEYMSTSYSPDCEYIDGAVVERNVGQGEHAFTQSKLLFRLAELTADKKLIVLVEQRTRVTQSRVRIPDVCVVQGLEEVVMKAPLLCVEVLSPDDRWSRVIASISDYQIMGVPSVWVIDPYQVKAWTFESENPPLRSNGWQAYGAIPGRRGSAHRRAAVVFRKGIEANAKARRTRETGKSGRESA